MGKELKTVNIKVNMPTAAVAERKVLFEISTAKREGVKVLKIIHGYGSTGVGGKLKETVSELLAQKKKEGIIKSFVSGEQWNIFNQSARSILEVYGELKNDSDLGSHNPGITIVLL